MAELLEYQQYAFLKLKAIIEKHSDEDWQQLVPIKEFGTKKASEWQSNLSNCVLYKAVITNAR